MNLNLSADEVLSTTRAVRKRLDFDRPVERDVIEACLRLAQQAPTASNRQHWHFVVVTASAKRRALGQIYRRGAERYLGSPTPAEDRTRPQSDREQTTNRVLSSARYLAKHMHEAPVLLVPCIEGRTEGASCQGQSTAFGSIITAYWSFMLAARERGLGTCLTTLHLSLEREAAEVLDIPFDDVMQVGLIPVAYTMGTDFKPAPREPLETMIHWNQW